MYRGVLKYQEPLAPYTSWRVGGCADQYYRPADNADLAIFLAALPMGTPVTWLGLGSNVLIHDAGIRGVVIHTLSAHSEMCLDGDIVRAEAGVTCAKLAKFSAKHGLMNAEFFAGIPGTVGGALAMNAGAWGGETWGLVTQIEVINRLGESQIRLPSEYTIGYRSVEGPADEWFVAGYFQLEPGDPLLATQKIKALLQQRNVSQPIGVFSGGSVFKNPPGDHAGRLIEASGLKGFRIGGAEVSPKHANFILNAGDALATDIWQLIEHIKAVVWQNYQVQLQTEVRLLGFKEDSASIKAFQSSHKLKLDADWKMLRDAGRK